MKPKILKVGNGNLWKGRRPIAGRLYLTQNTLHHFPNLTSMHRDECEVELSRIEKIEIGNTMALGFIPLPNEIAVILKDGEVLKYIVNGRKRWKEAIDQAVMDYQEQPETA